MRHVGVVRIARVSPASGTGNWRCPGNAATLCIDLVEDSRMHREKQLPDRGTREAFFAVPDVAGRDFIQGADSGVA